MKMKNMRFMYSRPTSISFDGKGLFGYAFGPLTQKAGKRIAFFGHFNSTNFGNESTLQATLYHLRCFQPDAEVICISTGHEATVATHQIEAIPLSEAFVKSWVPRNPVIRVLRKFCIGLPSEPYRWVKGLSGAQTCLSSQELDC